MTSGAFLGDLRRGLASQENGDEDQRENHDQPAQRGDGYHQAGQHPPAEAPEEFENPDQENTLQPLQYDCH